MKAFLTTGSVHKCHSPGRPKVSEETVDVIRTTFTQCPTKSVRRAARELHIPKSTVHKVLHRRLKLHAYKLQILHAIQPNDRPRRAQFASDLLKCIEEDGDYMSHVCFTDEATFHLSGKVNKQNVRIWGSEKPHAIREHIRDSPKVNVWCGLLQDKIIGPFFFVEGTITGNVYQDMLELYAIPQLDDRQPTIVFQHDGAPPHWSISVRTLLNEVFPGRWIGRGGPLSWPPRSPDITPLDFFLWGYVKDRVYNTAVPNLRILKDRIKDAIATVSNEMLSSVWQEVEYRLDILRATNGAHIEMYC